MGALQSAGAWHEIIVVDDGSADDTGARAAAAGAIVVRHPYNKGNGAAVKTGIRRATGDHVLIIDADGQHKPGDARRLVERLGDYDLVIAARSSSTQATMARRLGNALLNWLASYLTGRKIPDLTSGFRAAQRAELHARVPAPAAEWILDADDDDPGVHQGGLQRGLRADRRGTAAGQVEDQVCARWREVLPHPAEDRHDLQSAPRSSCRSASLTFAAGFLYAVWTIATQSHVTNSSVLLITLSVVIFLVGLVSEQISALQIREPAVGSMPVDRAPDADARFTRMDRRLLAAALLTALALRLVFALGYWIGKPLTHDELEYLHLGHSLAAGQGLRYTPRPTATCRTSGYGRAPLYPAFIAALEWYVRPRRHRQERAHRPGMRWHGGRPAPGDARTTYGRAEGRTRRGLAGRRLPAARLAACGFMLSESL